MTKRLVGAMAALAVLAAPGAARQDSGGLADVQKRLREVVAKVTPAYVFIGGGSGVCISPDGYILTNHHVAGGSESWSVKFSGGKKADAELVGWHPADDVALLKVKNGKDLPFVPLGDSEALRVGDPVIAVGNPFALGAENWEPTVTYGIVSALHVYLDNPGYKDAIQTDAQINPGNSGGPLITMKGEVVGINGRIEIKRFKNRVNSGIGYAIPSGQISRFLPHFKSRGRQWGGHLDGIQIGECGDDRYDNVGEYGDGSFVSGIDEGSPAQAAGLKEGDIISAIAGQKITNNNRFHGMTGSYPAGAVVPLKIKRWNKEKKVFDDVETRVLLGSIEQMKVYYASAGNRYYGFTPDYLFEGAGFKIGFVDKGAAGEKAGLKVDDVIVEAVGKPVATWVDFRQAMGARSPGDSVKLKVKRGTEELELAIKLETRDLPQDEIGGGGGGGDEDE